MNSFIIVQIKKVDCLVARISKAY